MTAATTNLDGLDYIRAAVISGTIRKRIYAKISRLQLNNIVLANGHRLYLLHILSCCINPLKI